jgi:hypothetical protein
MPRGDYLFEQAVEVNMNNTSGVCVEQDVFAMPIPKSIRWKLEPVFDMCKPVPQDEADHGHDGCTPAVR